MSKKYDNYGQLHSLAVTEFTQLLMARHTARPGEAAGFEEDILNTFLRYRHEGKLGHQSADKLLNTASKKRSIRFLSEAFVVIRKHYPHKKDWAAAQQAMFVELSRRVYERAKDSFVVYLQKNAG